jgi:uroporphyrinogen-III decarboxylase
MQGFAEETHATLGGEPVQIGVGAPGIGGFSPHMVAVDLVGVDFYWWQVEYPEACHRFLGKITDALIQTQEYFERIWPRQRGGFGLAEDSAQIMSLDTFREFCVPYDRRLYETLAAPGGDFGLHMCGDSTHLHPALVDDLRLTDFHIFGYLVPPQVAARNLGGKMRLWGNINPMLMKDGTADEVRAEARACLEALAPCGGLLLGDGANVCPGTPLENLAALTEAAEAYGNGQ